MNTTSRFTSPSEYQRARSALHALRRAPGRGLAAGVALVRLVQIARLARFDDHSGALEPIRPDEYAALQTVDDAWPARPAATRRTPQQPDRTHHRSAA